MVLPLISMAAVTGRLRSLRSNKEGSAAIEFAMIAPIFFGLLFALIETSMVFLAGQVLETGVQDGARLMYTSQNPSAADFKAAICAKVAVMMDCSKMDVDVRSYDPSVVIKPQDPIDSNGNYVSTNFVYQPSSYPSSNTVVVRAFYQWPLYVTGLGYNIANIGRGTSSSKRLLAATSAVGPQ